jgi:hypothetical protein
VAAGRALVDHRHVQVAVEGERQRAGDGRGAHHQHVGARAHLRQRQPLPHAEAVLLVDHHQPQPVELHALLDQRVRAHRDPRPAAGDAVPRLAPLLRPHPPGEQGDAHGEALEQLRQRAGVLLGQDLGGGHQRRLVAVLHRAQHGEERHHRLPRAHVALQQPVHPPRRGHVLADLLQHLLLRAGEREGEAPVEGLHQEVLALEGDPRARRHGAVAGERVQELQEEELLERQPPPPLLRLGERRGAVHVVQRLPERLHLHARQHLGGDAVFLLADAAQQVVQVVVDSLRTCRWVSPSVAG